MQYIYMGLMIDIKFNQPKIISRFTTNVKYPTCNTNSRRTVDISNESDEKKIPMGINTPFQRIYNLHKYELIYIWYRYEYTVLVSRS